MKTKLLFLAAVAMAGAGRAQTVRHFWIDAAKGSDTNAGTRAKPFQSITKGVATGPQDAVIHVLPGTYSPSKTKEAFTITFTSVHKNVRLVGTDANACIVDFERTVASNNAWYFLVDGGAKNIEICGLTLKNGAFRPTVPWFSAAVWWRSVDGLDLHHCVIESCESGIYSAAGAKNVLVHDNVFLGNNIACRFRQDSAAGARNCRFFNNLVANSTGGYNDTVSPSGKDPTQVFVNNIVVNNKGAGFQGSLPAGTVFESNCSFGNTNGNFNFGSQAVPKSNFSLDPQLADYAKRDFRLKPTSPCIEKGHPVGQPAMINDFYGQARVHDHDADRKAVPDIGVAEATEVGLTVSNFGQGKTAMFQLQKLANFQGPGIFIFGLGRGSLVLDPYGSFGINPLTVLFVFGTQVPSPPISLPFPSDSRLTNVAVYAQAFGFFPVSGGLSFKPSGLLELFL